MGPGHGGKGSYSLSHLGSPCLYLKPHRQHLSKLGVPQAAPSGPHGHVQGSRPGVSHAVGTGEYNRQGSLCGVLWSEQKAGLAHACAVAASKAQRKMSSRALPRRGVHGGGGRGSGFGGLLFGSDGQFETLALGRLEASGLTGPGLHRNWSEQLAPPTGWHLLSLSQDTLRKSS